MILNQAEIKRILPHRSPILLVDEVTALDSGKSIEATVYLNPDWDIFNGHFPGRPILPGIYISESLAQAADLMLMTLPVNQQKTPILSQISQMRFLRRVSPSDTLLLHASLLADAGNGIYDCSVTAFVLESDEKKRVATGRITLTMK